MSGEGGAILRAARAADVDGIRAACAPMRRQIVPRAGTGGMRSLSRVGFCPRRYS